MEAQPSKSDALSLQIGVEPRQSSREAFGRVWGGWRGGGPRDRQRPGMLLGSRGRFRASRLEAKAAFRRRFRGGCLRGGEAGREAWASLCTRRVKPGSADYSRCRQGGLTTIIRQTASRGCCPFGCLRFATKRLTFLPIAASSHRAGVDAFESSDLLVFARPGCRLAFQLKHELASRDNVMQAIGYGNCSFQHAILYTFVPTYTPFLYRLSDQKTHPPAHRNPKRGLE